VKKRGFILLIVLYLVIAVVYGAQVQQTATIVYSNSPGEVEENTTENITEPPQLEQPAPVEEDNFLSRFINWISWW